MLRRFSSLPRTAVSVTRAGGVRSFSKPSALLSASTQLSSSNVILELDAKKVGNEIRKRGLANAIVGGSRDHGMDRVSLSSCSDGERSLSSFLVALWSGALSEVSWDPPRNR